MRKVVVTGIAVLLLGACGGGERAQTETVGAPVLTPTTVAETTSVPTTVTTAPPPPPPPPAPAPTTVTTVQQASRSRTASAPPPVVKQPPPRPNRTTGGAPAQPPPPTSRAVFDEDFPDPFVLRAGAYWYAFSTQSGATQVPVIRSADLVNWERLGDALPALPSWSGFGSVWAPSVMARPVGGYVMYFTTKHAQTGLQCLSRAFSALPEGPYVDTSSGPFVCQTDRGGSIDPSPFTAADGSPWLAWKSEGTIEGEPTRIWTAPLAPDGGSLVADPVEVLRTSEVWEGPIVEAPSMVVEGGVHHLFFSGNRWETPDYAVGHAVCAGPAGPCRRVPAEPIARTDSSRAGPGGGELFRGVDGRLLVAYHAWSPSAIGYPSGARRLHIDAVTISGESAAVAPRQDTSMI